VGVLISVRGAAEFIAKNAIASATRAAPISPAISAIVTIGPVASV
jgi:hypothetical protein